jgi:hypothetical protein
MATGVKNILFGVCVVCTPSRMKKKSRSGTSLRCYMHVSRSFVGYGIEKLKVGRKGE